MKYPIYSYAPVDEDWANYPIIIKVGDQVAHLGETFIPKNHRIEVFIKRIYKKKGLK